MQDAPAALSATSRQAIRQTVETLVVLFKLRVVALLLLASLGGAFLGYRGVPPLAPLAILLLTGALAAGGASAINHYLERGPDALMLRTRRRPFASGQIRRPAWVIALALAMIVVAALSVLPARPLMSLYLALGALIYVGVYTVWLKPRSVVNIVIGGAAGSCAVMTGGAAVGAASDPGVIVLALLVFLWTPAHFWALAAMYKDDYAAAGVPMLPVHASASSTAWWIFVHAASTGLAAIALAAYPTLGWLYLIPAAGVVLYLAANSVNLIRRPERQQAIRVFVASNVFLALILVLIMLASAMHDLFF